MLRESLFAALYPSSCCSFSAEISSALHWQVFAKGLPAFKILHEVWAALLTGTLTLSPSSWGWAVLGSFPGCTVCVNFFVKSFPRGTSGEEIRCSSSKASTLHHFHVSSLQSCSSTLVFESKRSLSWSIKEKLINGENTYFQDILSISQEKKLTVVNV